MFDPQYLDMIDCAVDRVEAQMALRIPRIAPRVTEWMHLLAGSDDAADYYKHPRAFAFLLVPWLLERLIAQQPDMRFQSDLAYSSVNGYYFIRLFDNIMDDDAPLEKQILPATAFFYREIQKSFEQYFERDHPFWEYFETAWLQQCEATVLDEGQGLIDRAAFAELVAQKVCGARIPLAAVCLHYDRPDLIEPWAKFLNCLGQWHLMQQDVFDWSKDLRQGKLTYFLSEATVRRRPGEAVAAWVVREGLDWGIETLIGWMAEIIALAHDLNCPPLVTYLQARQATLVAQVAQMRAGLGVLAALSQAALSQAAPAAPAVVQGVT